MKKRGIEVILVFRIETDDWKSSKNTTRVVFCITFSLFKVEVAELYPAALVEFRTNYVLIDTK